jgi:D-alanyl-D-alanine carboxypeptidase (penicillin-binding protein 5/6)
MLVAREFMKNQALIEYSSFPSYKIPPTNKSEQRHIYNRNALKSSYTTSKYLNPNAIGMNAGMTSGGGYCVVTGVKNGGVEYICIVMGAKHGSESDTTYSYSIANELIAQITKLGDRLVLSADEKIAELKIEGASLGKDSVALRPANDVIAYLPEGYDTSGLLDISYVFSFDKAIAPVKEGETVGKVVVSYNGEIVSVSDVVIAEDVEREFIIYALFMIKSFLTSRRFALILFSLSIIVSVKLIISSRAARKKGRYVGRRY